MKIVYGAGPRRGSQFILERFLKESQFEVKVAGHGRYLDRLEVVDWVLDGFGIKLPSSMIFDIEEFAPDLIISDGELITAKIAQKLNIPYYSCSPLHLYDGIEWEKKTALRYTKQLQDIRKFWEPFPPAKKRFIYSPFGDISMRPFVRDSYEWIKPYHGSITSGCGGNTLIAIDDADRRKIVEQQLWLSQQELKLSVAESFQDFVTKLPNSSWVITSGETQYVGEILYHQKRFSIVPSISDAETLLNAILVSTYNFGQDLGQIEFLEKYTESYILKNVGDKIEYNLSIQDNVFLHQRIAQLWNL